MIRVSMLFLFFCFVSCGSKQNRPEKKVASFDFVQDIPCCDRKDNNQLRWKEMLAAITGLPNIEDGVRGLEYRITYVPEQYGVMDIYIIRQLVTEWSGEFIQVDVIKIAQDSLSKALKSKTKVSPRTSWESLISKIDDFGISNFPDSKILRFYNRDFMDSDDYIEIEIATSNLYKIIYYPFLKANERISYVIKAKELVNLLKSELKPK